MAYNTIGIARKSAKFVGVEGCKRHRVLVDGDAVGEAKNPQSPGVVEVVSLALSAGAGSDGNVTVTLGGVGALVAVLATDTTATAVATKIRAATFPLWTTGGSGATVTFTATTPGPRPGANSYSPAGTGAAGTITTTTEGSGQGANAAELAGVSFDSAADGKAVALAQYGYPEIEVSQAIPIRTRVNVASDGGDANSRGRVKAVDENAGTVVNLVGITKTATTAAGQKAMVDCRRFGEQITI